MVLHQEVDPRRDGGMKSMTSVDLLHGSIKPKTDCHGKTMMRPSSNKLIDTNWLIFNDDTCKSLLSYVAITVFDGQICQGSCNQAVCLAAFYTPLFTCTLRNEKSVNEAAHSICNNLHPTKYTKIVGCWFQASNLCTLNIAFYSKTSSINYDSVIHTLYI